MEKRFDRRLVTLLVGFALVLVLLAGPILHEGASTRLKMALILTVGTLGLAVLGVNARRGWNDRAHGRPLEDEFTELARSYAATVAFKMSMVLWLVIFATQNYFDSTRTMLGLGILGQCGFYGICLAFFSRTGSLYED